MSTTHNTQHTAHAYLFVFVRRGCVRLCGCGAVVYIAAVK